LEHCTVHLFKKLIQYTDTHIRLEDGISKEKKREIQYSQHYCTVQICMKHYILKLEQS